MIAKVSNPPKASKATAKLPEKPIETILQYPTIVDVCKAEEKDIHKVIQRIVFINSK
jgi:hypothetical protein